MQYTNYIALYNARREREQQLIQKYDQHPAGLHVQNLWLHQVEKSTSHKINPKEIVGAIIGIAAAGIVLLLSIWL